MNSKQTIILFCRNKHSSALNFAMFLGDSFGKKVIVVEVDYIQSKYLFKRTLSETKSYIDEYDPVMVVFEYSTDSWKNRRLIQNYLNAFRELRVPYIGYNAAFSEIKAINNIIVPVGFLNEEKEKAPWSNSFIKYCGSKITLLKPKDRGKRAHKNVEFIKKVIRAQKNDCVIVQGKENSFKVEFEAVNKFSKSNNLLIISASRAYGLDDEFFGPKEYHVLKKSSIPVLLINPRDDIYVLCGD